MTIKIFVILAILAMSLAHMKWKSSNPNLYTFNDYELEFNKKYADEQEHEIRKMIFHQNLEKVKRINSDPNSTWKAAVNQFTDRFDYELERMKGKHRGLNFQNKSSKFYSPNFNYKTDFLKNLPDSVDWREKGVISAVRNQGHCGSCWAFSTIAVSEAHVAIATGKLLSLSEQQLVDCVPNPEHCGGTGGCEGLVEPIAYDYLAGSGYVTRDDYIYTAKDGTCRDASMSKVATIEGHIDLKENDPQELMNAVATKGPISISVAASDFHFYDSGIYNGDCGYVTNHAVVLVGYGEDQSGKYWIVRNSWGEDWGEQGYIRLPREPDFSNVECGWDLSPKDGAACDGGPDKVWVCGKCGMYSGSSYPFGAKLS